MIFLRIVVDIGEWYGPMHSKDFLENFMKFT